MAKGFFKPFAKLRQVENMYLMGIDIGTTGCKVLVLDETGQTAVFAYREYPLIFPRAGWMELDPKIVAESIFDCITQCTDRCDGGKIGAIAVSSQGEAVVPVRKDGTVLANSIVTFDPRSTDEADWLERQVSKKELMEITGAPIHSMFTITKLLWMKKNTPEILKHCWKFMCFGDFISYLLGAKPAIDYSMASRTMLFDIRKKGWSNEILQICSLSEEQFSEPVPSGSIIGKIEPPLAKRLKISPDTLIVSGGHDQVCCAVGCGVFRSGCAMDSLGTTESIVCVNHELVVTPQMVENNIPVYVYPLPNLYAYLSFLSSSGSVLKWFRDQVLRSTDPDIYREMDDEAQQAFPGPSGLFVLPHFAGSGTPYLNDQSKGLISGLTLNSSMSQIYKAIIEGTCYEARMNIDVMRRSGIEFDELRCIGGGAKSDLWLQVKANITNMKVVAMEVNEAGCLGAALLAGLGAGMFEDVESVIGNYTSVKHIYLPDHTQHERYCRLFEDYSKIYERNYDLFGGLQ